MATAIGNIPEGNAYVNTTGTSPVSPPANTKGDFQFGNNKANKVVEKNLGRGSPTKEDAKEADIEDLKQASDSLSKMVQSMGANLTFSIHEATNRLMVRMVDPDNGTILREYPSSEFLDMVARIRDYVGNLLDKKV